MMADHLDKEITIKQNIRLGDLALLIHNEYLDVDEIVSFVDQICSYNDVELELALLARAKKVLVHTEGHISYQVEVSSGEWVQVDAFNADHALFIAQDMGHTVLCIQEDE